MNLQCRPELASLYKTGPQIARILTEEWVARELYCPACSSDQLSQSKTNAPVIDFTCPGCEQLFQLKGLRNWNPQKLVDAGYEAMIRAIRADRVPNLLVLQYSASWCVTNLMLIPRVFFSESIIEKRKPLALHARRAGWVGCNILLGQIASDGKIAMVSDGAALPSQRVRSEFSRVRKLAEVPPSVRGWTLDVLSAVRKLGKSSFSLDDIYKFESELRESHPLNRHVRPKIRQQLQVLRDLGLVEFTTPGSYRIKEYVSPRG
jgi:type II restriction enzyme